MNKTDQRKPYRLNRVLLVALIVILFAAAFGIRIFDLDDPPLDFHSTRQLRSLMIARGMYYQGLEDAPELQREVAVQQWQDLALIEPPLFERLVALTYRIIGAEIPWVSRIYSILFWLAGGIPLFLLARRMTGSVGGLLALAYYLILPFGIIASRSFQPDPLMVSLVIFSWWAFYRWFYDQIWGKTILAGILIGMAIFVKSVAVLMISGGALVLILVEKQFKAMLHSTQAWVLAALSILPAAIFMLIGLFTMGMSRQFEGRFFPEMLINPAHYVSWLFIVIGIVGFAALIGALLGVIFFRKKSDRAYVLGFWVGYLVYGLLFPYHFLTHNYYHLPLIPLIGLSLAPIGEIFWEKYSEKRPGKLTQVGVLAIFLAAMAVQIWDARVTLAREDYRHEPPYWSSMGDMLSRDVDVVALSQDYGNRLAYYGWLSTTNWPGTGQQDYRDLRGGIPLTFEQQFERYTEGQNVFLVTNLNEFEKQGELYEYLNTNFPVIAEGQGYLVFDLRNPLP